MSTKYFMNTQTKNKKFNKNLYLIRGNLFKFKFILFNLKL